MANYIKAYTVDWNNEESDSLHLAYSYDKEVWYNLNGNNGVLFAKSGSKRMAAPQLIKFSEDSYKVIAKDALDDSKVFVYETKDLITYGEEVVCNKDDIKEYNEDANIIEISDAILKGLNSIWGKPEPVVIKEIEEIKMEIEAGQELALPEKVKLEYSNGMVEYKKVEWSKTCVNGEEIDTNKTGEYELKGYVKEHIYTNPLIFHRADPFIYRHTDGNYYFTASHTDMEHNLDGKYQYRNITIRKAATLEDLADGSGKYVERIVYAREPLPGDNSPHIWAPEIHYINGKWYIYFTTTIDENQMWSIRPHALECDGDPMEAEWVNKGPIQKTIEDTIAFTDFSLDHTVLQHKGELYLFWAEKHPQYSDIYAAKMVNPWTIDSSRICKVVAPEYNWELHGFPVCEGPGFIKRNGKIFMTYSASGTDALYCLGLMTADEDADLLDEKSWTKSPFPVFQSCRETGQFGPGHNSFTVDDEGNDIFVYHARQEERYLVDPGYQPLYDAGRNASVVRAYWNPDGTPNLSIPTRSGKGEDIKHEVTARVFVR